MTKSSNEMESKPHARGELFCNVKSGISIFAIVCHPRFLSDALTTSLQFWCIKLIYYCWIHTTM